MQHLRAYNLDRIRDEFMRWAPSYAGVEAREALDKVIELQAQGILRNGIYYIVLADLSGSTAFAAEHGNPALSRRIQTFITCSFKALRDARLTNLGLFLREIGDAVLLVFQHFPDILSWVAHFRRQCRLSQYEPPILFRTVVHIGEVSLDGVNPISLAISQTFKVEKAVSGGQIVLTAPAYSVAWPTIARAYHAFSPAGEASMIGYDQPVSLMRFDSRGEDDLERAASEAHRF